MEGKALTALAGLSAYSSSSGGRIAALKTHSSILVFYRKFQNDFREICRGKTGYIDDVVTHARTQLSDKRPLIGMKGLRKEFKELQESKEAAFAVGDQKLAFKRPHLHLLQSDRFGPSVLLELLELLFP